MQKKKISKIMCCCGNGVGTSLLMQMTMEEAVEILGLSGVDIVFGSLSEASEESADLFVVSVEVQETVKGLPVIGLEDLMDAQIAAEKLRDFLENC